MRASGRQENLLKKIKYGNIQMGNLKEQHNEKGEKKNGKEQPTTALICCHNINSSNRP